MQHSQVVRDSGLDAVIGMYPTVHRARTTVVDPWTSLARGDRAVRAPRSVLLYGPTGCGVSFIAHRLVDELAAVASTPAVVMESVDDDVVSGGPDALSDALGSSAFSDVVVVGVSHRPWDVPLGDAGFERLVFVPPPDWDARRFRIWETSWGSALSVADLDRVVVATERWSGSDLAGLDQHVGASADDVLARVESIRPSSAAWLDRAGEVVRRSGPGGGLDDLAGYLQRYRLL